MSTQNLQEIESALDSMNDLEKWIIAKKIAQLKLTEWPGTFIGFRALIACSGYVDLASEWICRVESDESKLIERYEYIGGRRKFEDRDHKFEIGEFTDAFKLEELGIPGRLLCHRLDVKVESLPEGIPFGKRVGISRLSVLENECEITLSDKTTEKGYLAADHISRSSNYNYLPIRIDLAHVFSEEEKKNPRNETQIYTFVANFKYLYPLLDENRCPDPFNVKGELGLFKGVNHVKG